MGPVTADTDGSQQDSDHRNDDPATGDVHAQRTGRFILQRQQVALPQHKDGGDEANHYIQKQGLEIVPGLHGDVSVDDAGNARIIAPCAGVEGAHEPCKHGVDRHAD